MAVPKAYLDRSLPMKFMHVVKVSKLSTGKDTSPMERKADMPKKAYRKGGTYLEKVGNPESVDAVVFLESSSLSFAASSSFCCSCS
eukprot:scaffold482_cov266-Amphora_coffeaeformis.AAC.33